MIRRRASNATVDLLAIVQDRMQELKLSRYWLAAAVADRVSARSVYYFLAGKRDLNHVALGHILHALGLSIRRQRELPPPPRKLTKAESYLERMNKRYKPSPADRPAHQ
jgi:hypothetical protein